MKHLVGKGADIEARDSVSAIEVVMLMVVMWIINDVIEGSCHDGDDDDVDDDDDDDDEAVMWHIIDTNNH